MITRAVRTSTGLVSSWFFWEDRKRGGRSVPCDRCDGSRHGTPQGGGAARGGWACGGGGGGGGRPATSTPLWPSSSLPHTVSLDGCTEACVSFLFLLRHGGTDRVRSIVQTSLQAVRLRSSLEAVEHARALGSFYTPGGVWTSRRRNLRTYVRAAQEGAKKQQLC